ncbi:sulfatase [Clostridium sp. WB02_MRS01]|uniref:sulfatase family protein n=1 Tax=Clostridium sp. WB02_MRS01 TaxID=2605777 RepID=UPI0012B2988E|nr:sulfatase [Clostridium sp. WB02_MRS01]MSS07237.1 sulfatase [Clostridium sp. WB02_MRS01]
MKTNLLYVFADQWRAHAIGYMNMDQVVTPNIDSFAQESMRFTNAYSTFPLCSPHRASLMTGKYPFRVGMWTNCKIGLEEKVMLRPQELCIGDVLKAEGYQTGYIGKWHLDASELNFSSNPKSGAKDWDAYTPPGERRHGFDYWLSYGAWDDHLDPHYWQDDEKQIKPGKWSAEFETDKAIEYMEARKGEEQPFALYLSYNPPHLPYELVPDRYYDKFKDLEVHYRENVPEEMREKGGLLETQTRQYYAAVHGIDEQFGRILQYLKDHNMEENTIVVLSADHGEMLGSHGLMSKNVWYEESIHIPLMMRQKGRIQAVDNDGIFASPDHMPTILELLDLSIPETCEGYSHVKGMFGKDENEPQDMLICSYPGGADAVKAFSDKGLTHKAYGWRGIKDERYTYVIFNGYAPGEEQKEYLYDNKEDPYQINPELIDKDCQRTDILAFREKLKNYLCKTEDPFLWDR